MRKEPYTIKFTVTETREERFGSLAEAVVRAAEIVTRYGDGVVVVGPDGPINVFGGSPRHHER